MDTVVVGGGLAGLTAGALLARVGARVTVFEAAGELGGHARTQVRDGYCFNLGPHALYRAGANAKVLHRLGVEVTGGTVALTGASFLRQGELVRRSALALDAAQVAGVLAAVPWQRTGALTGLSAAEWIEGRVRRPGARSLLATGIRVSTYCADLERLAADAAVRQLAVSARSVRYLDGGWAQLTDGIRAAAERVGARIVTGARVVHVAHDGVAVRGVELADGQRLRADAVVIAAGGPAVAAAVAEVPGTWAADAVPVHAACLDVALSRLPDPSRPVVLGLDEPLYCSVHTRWGRLAPPGGALVHALRYLREGETGQRGELEALLDAAQPGWRDLVVRQRFLPRLEVASAMPLASGGGLAARPGPRVPGVEGLCVAGDWVGGEGLLADAAFASAERAADAIVSAPAAVPVGDLAARSGGDSCPRS